MTNVDSNVRAASGGDEKSARGWRLGEAVTYENLTVFPVYASRQADTSGFATLDEALASGDAVVTEQGSYIRRTREGGGGTTSYGSAQVNQLVLINRGKRPLLLLAGEVVSGGKTGSYHRQRSHRSHRRGAASSQRILRRARTGEWRLG